MANFVRVPPDSTGKKVRHSRKITVVLTITNQSKASTIQRGDLISGTISGAEGIFTGRAATNDGFSYYLDLDTNEVFQIGDVLVYDSVEFANVTFVEDIQTLDAHIVDQENPNHSLGIDSDGAVFTRFKDGTLLLDSFGKAEMSQTTPIKSWLFLYESLSNQFQDRSVAGGGINHDPSSSELQLTTGTGATDSIKRNSLIYFPYTPSQSNQWSISFAAGDAGKENVVRRWGLFDDEDGLYFELNGTQLSVNIRSSVSNTVDSVTQENWNENQLLNGNIDPWVLDVAKYNLYWIDYRWQGTGIVRFGLYSPDGQRITVHSFETSNSNVTTYMKRGTLPIGLEQFNTGIVGSPSIMKTTCISVSRSSQKIENTGELKTTFVPEIAIGIQEQELWSFRVKSTVNGVANRAVIILRELQFALSGDPIIIRAKLNMTLDSPAWTSASSFSEIDSTSGTNISGGFLIDQLFVGPGVSEFPQEESIEQSVGLSPDGLFQFTITFTAQVINGGSAAVVSSIAKWRETL